MASCDNDLIMTGAVTTVVSGPGDVFSLQPLLLLLLLLLLLQYICHSFIILHLPQCAEGTVVAAQLSL